MNNEWKMVPVELLERILGCISYGEADELKALLAAPMPPAVESVLRTAADGTHIRISADGSIVPVPPAGDVEGLMISLKDHKVGQAALLEHIESLKADRVRLTAERDGLQSELTKALEDLRLEKVAGAAIRQQAEDFKALSWERGQELTKARELLNHMQTYSNKYPTSPIGEYKNQIAEVLAHQSAPAAKGSPKVRESLLKENQRVTPARFKCLACGEYHEGMSGLPCPKMTPYSQVKP